MRAATSTPVHETVLAEGRGPWGASSNLYQLPLRAANTDVEVDPGLEWPGSIRDVALVASRAFPGLLHLGRDVSRGLALLRDEHGLVCKVWRDLAVLASLGKTLQTSRGKTGSSVVPWVRERGVTASEESRSVRQDPAQRAKRSFHDGVQRRFFSLHTKPTNACPRDRCVRIYFDVETQSHSIIIGYIGPHP